MSQVIVITSGKGGVGKTTTAANIGVGLAALGKKVILIDTDIGLRNLDIALGTQDSIMYDLVDVVKGRASIEKATVSDSRFENLFMIPAAQSCDKDAVSDIEIKSLCDELREIYDFVIVDCPAGIEQGFKNAIAGADRALVVTTPDFPSIRDADRVLGLLGRYGIKDCELIINKIRLDLIKSGSMLNVDEVLELIRITLLGIIPDDASVISGAFKGEPAVTNKKSLAGQDYRNICNRLIGNRVSLLEIEKKGIFRRKRR